VVEVAGVAEAEVGVEVVTVALLAAVVRVEVVRARPARVLPVRERSIENSFPAARPLLQGSAETGARN